MFASRTARSMTSAVRTVARQATATRTYVAPAAVRVTASTVRPVNIVAKRSNATAGTKDVSRSAWAQDPKISYREVKKLSDQPNTDILLVDVREKEENVLGSIPGSVNLPLSRLADSLDRRFNAGDFQKEFTFEKPLPTQKMVFFCRSGKRSATAADLAEQKGYHDIRNYEGSWLDWQKHQEQKGSNYDDDDD